MTKQIVSTIFLYLLTAIPASATTYYISKSGSDSNNGQSWSQAWSTVARVNSAMRPGDTAFFGTGTWYSSQLVPPAGGDADHVTLYACSSFVAGISHIYGGDRLTGWVQHTGSIYKTGWKPTLNPSTYITSLNTYCVVQNDSMLARQSSLGDVNGPGKFYQTPAHDSLYVWVYGGNDPDNYAMHASVSGVLRLDQGQDYIHVWGFDFRYANKWLVNFADNHHGSYCTIEHCSLSFVNDSPGNNTACIGFLNAGDDRNGRYDTIRACNLSHVKTTPMSNDHASAFIIYAAEYLCIESCYIGPDLRYGIQWKGGLTHPPRGLVFRYNTIVGLGGDGIFIQAGYNDSTYGNIIYDCSVGISFGMYCEGGFCGGGPHYVLNNTMYNLPTSWKSGEYGGSAEDSIIYKYNISYTPNKHVVMEYSNIEEYYGYQNMFYGGGR